MLSQPDILMSTDGKEAPLTQQLIHRLHKDKPKFDLSLLKNKKAESTKPSITPPPPKETPPPILEQKEPIGETRTLAHPIQTFQKHKTKSLNNYLIQFEERTVPYDNTLYVLHGWRPEFYLDPLFSLTTRSRFTSGGFFIKWNGKGIVINPGRHFLENFHKQGLHIRDIHAVIVTRRHPEAHTDIQEIYALNYRLNKNSSNTHVIHYYLAQKAFQPLASLLKPHFKQEKHSLHCLDLFLDSQGLEKIEIDPTITLHYFALSQEKAISEGKQALHQDVMGLKLELKSNKEEKRCHFAYLSGGPWQSFISQILGDCDLLLTGFGSTHPTDYQMQKYAESCLGYYGTYSLLTEVNPKLLLCSEFSGADGDIRLEVIKLLRQQLSINKQVTIQPADVGMLVNLDQLRIQCSITKQWVDAHQIHVAKTRDGFGLLQYLSPSCWV